MATKTTQQRTSIGRWATHTILGPMLATYGAVGLYTAFGGHDGFKRWAILVLGVLVGTLWAVVYSLALALVDVALLGLRVRALPAGKRGWGLSSGSPLACFAIYTVLPPASFYKFGPWAVVAAVVLPMIVVAAISRVAGGEKAYREDKK